MSLQLYNTLTKQEEVFHPINDGEVRMYTCGPTVYGRPHIGNYSSLLLADLLRRWLEVGHKLKVTQVKNITDVGHLVADNDEGEDKVETQAKKEFGEVTHDSVIGIARKYEDQYKEDEKALNMRPVTAPRATEYIEHMKDMIEDLLEKNIAYQTDDGIYFDVTANVHTPYGSLSGNVLDELSAGSRVDVNTQKKHPADFALWKFCVGKNEHHALRWESPGHGNPEGFPGWHIECSAMSRALLGDQIDIHTGGEDNIFPHHECEIAQSESVTDASPFVAYWIHKRHIDMGDTKMSKSLGNVLTLPDIEAMGYSPQDLRYYLLSVHYRTNLKFAEKGLSDARKARRKIMEWMGEVDSGKWIVDSEMDEGKAMAQKGSVDTTKSFFEAAMDSDLNTPDALSRVFEMMSGSRAEKWQDGITQKAFDQLIEFITIIRETFGCFEPEDTEEIPATVQELVSKREQARASKDFEASDSLRDEIQKLGYEVKDTADGQKIIKMMT